MVDVIERGDLYFFYRPKVRGEGETQEVHGPEEVQRFYMVMSPHGKGVYWLLVLGRKHLPKLHDGGERLWGFVDRVEKEATTLRDELQHHRYRTKTRGVRELPAARPAGEGVYGLVRHDRHTHFAYVLELPSEPGEVQREFNIESEGGYVISVKSPTKPSPRGAGLPTEEKAKISAKKVNERFRGRRFAEPDPPDLLDHAGVEFVLVGAEENVEGELGIDLKAESENAATAEIFSDLRLRRSGTAVRPLFEGKWQ
jgi:hypothetical protein